MDGTMQFNNINNNRIYYGMHAMGMWRGQTYTNSKEAFGFWHKKGVNIFEVDVSLDIHGKYVLSHSFLDNKFVKKSVININDFVGLIIKYQKCVFVIDTYSLCLSDLSAFLDEFDNIVHSREDSFSIDNSIYNRIFFESYSFEETNTLNNRFNKPYKRIKIIACINEEGENHSDGCYMCSDINGLISGLKEQEVGWVSYKWSGIKKKKQLADRLHAEQISILSLSRTNVNKRKKTKYHIKLNLVDYCINEKTFFIFWFFLVERSLLLLMHRFGIWR